MSVAPPQHPRVGVLAIQGAFVEHERALERAGAESVQVRRPDQLEGLNGLVLPGGESTTLGLVGSESGLLDAIGARQAAGLPILGTCAGMIVLARATTEGAQPLVGGLDLTVRRNAFGRQLHSFEADVAVEGEGLEGGMVQAVFIRAPWIEEWGPQVEIVARYGGRPVAARQGEVLVTAFHPELSGEGRFHRWLVTRARAHQAGAISAGRSDARVRA